MSFTFIGNPEAIAKQNLPWGIGLLIIGIVALVYAFGKDRTLIWIVIGCLLLFAGGITTWRAKMIGASTQEWRITADAQTLEWQSANEQIDPSFSVQLDSIDHIVVESYENMPEIRNKYTLITREGSKIELNPVSGINLEELTRFLQTENIERKDVIHETAKK